MTYIDVMKRDIRRDFLVYVVSPILIIVITYNVYIYINGDSPLDYFSLLLVCGLPFGIKNMFNILIPSNISTLVLNIFIGCIIGDFVMIWKLALAIYYLILTIVRIRDLIEAKQEKYYIK
ncbi:DUF6050 family protein [Clostridium cadaveris]|uniref:DUF6050 family protein n=1 Tax=Clostridium cadaveris TaxID=1529 RepID=UPI0031CEA381